MSFRGRGRGRGGYGGGRFPAAKQVPYELFPEIEELGTAAGVKENISLAIWYSKFQKYWNSSPYYIEDENEGSKKTQRTEIERFSDRNSEKTRPKPPLSHFVRVDPAYVPAELAKGEKKEKRGKKRVRWNPESDMKKLDDVFEKLDQKHQGQEADEKKEDEEEEEEEKDEEEEEEYSDDGDYNQNVDFDDDEDDFNIDDDNDDEPTF